MSGWEVTKVTQDWKQIGLDAAEVVDAWRVVPRTIMFGYGWIVWHNVQWFQGLEDPSGFQMGFSQIIWGAAALLTAWYFNTGRKWGDVNGGG